MGKITEALKKVNNDRVKKIQKRPEIRYVVRKVANTKVDEHIVAFHDHGSPISEQFKILRTHIQSLRQTKNMKTFVITSSIDGEGKSVTSVNLAITMAHGLNNKSVLLIDADMRKSKVGKYLGLPSHVGLSELLEGKAEADDVLVSPDIPNLTVILAGKHPKNPSELLQSKRMEEYLSMFKSKFDYILIDTPPVMPVTDACNIAPLTDGVIMVVQAGRTQRELVTSSETRLYQARAKTLGYVVTNVELHIPNYLYRYINRYDNSYYYYRENKQQQPVETGGVTV